MLLPLPTQHAQLSAADIEDTLKFAPFLLNQRVDHTLLPSTSVMTLLPQVLTVAGPIIITFLRLPRGSFRPSCELLEDTMAYSGPPTVPYQLAFLLDEVSPQLAPMMEL